MQRKRMTGHVSTTMDDLDALLEDLQAVVPRSASERPGSKQSMLSNSTSTSGGSGGQKSNGYGTAPSSAVNGGSNPSALDPSQSTMSGGGGAKMVSPITHASSNLAELDSLLESLNSPNLGMDLDDEALRALGVHMSTGTDGGGHAKSQATYPPPPPVRPDVDHLLTDLDNAVSVEALPPPPKDIVDPPPPASSGYRSSGYPSDTAPGGTASTSAATRDLDALMASLSDFQMTTSTSTGPKQQASSAETDLYAHPKTVLSSSSSGAGAEDPSASPASRLNQLDTMLGHLQSDMSRQGITSTAKGTCSACQKDIVGQVITALGRTWHPHHFVCVICKEELATKNFFEREGQAYCEKDYHERFAPKCAYCNGAILERCMTALGKTWHPEHFICAHCGNPFGPNESFHEKEGRPYCHDDYYALFAPKCGACDRPICDSFVSALKKQWHPECFNCMECGESFKGGNFFEHDMMPYCEKHYYNRQGAACSQCKAPISGRCITAMGQKYHPEHFVCAFCMKQLSMGTFKEHGERPYCMKCYGKLFV